MNDEMPTMRNEVVMAYWKVLNKHVAGRMEENHERP